MLIIVHNLHVVCTCEMCVDLSLCLFVQAGIAHMPQDKSLKIYLLPTSIITHEIGKPVCSETELSLTVLSPQVSFSCTRIRQVTPGEDFRCQCE